MKTTSRALRTLLILLAALSLSLAACSDDDAGNDSDTSQTSSSGADASSGGDMTTSSGDMTTSSGDMTTSSGDMTTSSGDMTTSSGDMGADMTVMHDLVLTDTVSTIQFGECLFATCGGGVLAGEWDALDTCFDPDTAACPDATVTVTDNNSRTSVLFDESGLYVRLTEIDITSTVEVPSSCTMGAPCAFIAGAVPGATECVDSMTIQGCDCTVVIQDSDEEVGTWSTDGDLLTVIVDGNTTVTEYCSDGIQATLFDSEENVTVNLEKR